MTNATHKKYNTRSNLNKNAMPADDVFEANKLYIDTIGLPLREAMDLIWKRTIPGSFSRKTLYDYGLSRELFFVYLVSVIYSTYGIRWCDLEWRTSHDGSVWLTPIWGGLVNDVHSIVFCNVAGVRLNTPREFHDELKAVKSEREFLPTTRKAMDMWTKALRKDAGKKNVQPVLDMAKSLANFIGK